MHRPDLWPIPTHDVPRYLGPLLTRAVAESMSAARQMGREIWSGSLDLERSRTRVLLEADGWHWRGRNWLWPTKLRERTIYHWNGEDWAPIQRYSGALVKLIASDWGAPTFEIDGIKMLPTARVSPFEDARCKAMLVEPRGRSVLDTCGGLGYYAAACLDLGVARIRSFERNEDVLWLRRFNPWSPDPEAPSNARRFELSHADITRAIAGLPDAGFDAILHDPPRFSIAGELYSQVFYEQLARVIRPGGRMFHYTGSPNQLSHGRDLPREVIARLVKAGFEAEPMLDGVLAVRRHG